MEREKLAVSSKHLVPFVVVPRNVDYEHLQMYITGKNIYIHVLAVYKLVQTYIVFAGSFSFLVASDD